MYWQSMIKDMSFASTRSPELCGTDSGTMPYTFHQYTLLGPDFTDLQDGIDQYYNVGQYDYSYDSELFFITISPLSVSVRPTGIYLRTVDRGRGCISTVNICSSTAAAKR